MSQKSSDQPVRLKSLFPAATFLNGDDIVVSRATERSEVVQPGDLFAAIPGTKRDGCEFAPDAVSRGATSILTATAIPNLSVPQCVVPDVRRAFAALCDALSGSPSTKLQLAGVTGTNGKTTTTWLIRSIVQAAGHQAGVLGTIEYHDGKRCERANLTTPDSQMLSSWLSSMVASGTTHAAMELSSHALDQGRACGTRLDVAIVTNVTQDHFDYHKEFESYLFAKSHIADHLKPDGVLVLNADDPGSMAILKYVSPNNRVVTFGIDPAADVTATILEESTAGTRFVLGCGGDAIETKTPLIGRHNVANALAAAAAAQHFCIPLRNIARGIEQLVAVPGRMERVVAGQPFDIFVDFAHTDDALRRCVTNLRRLCSRRIIVVFGAGGDRDRGKRPKMAQAVMGADQIVVTSDNPRTEEPQRIIDDILAGFGACPSSLHVDPNRAAAIAWALENARSGDCVLIAGKGHETEQIIGTRNFPFDDREVARYSWNELTSAKQQLVLAESRGP